MGAPAQRRPGDGNDWDRQAPASFLGLQSSDGNAAGPLLAVQRLVRWLVLRVPGPRRRR